MLISPLDEAKICLGFYRFGLYCTQYKLSLDLFLIFTKSARDDVINCVSGDELKVVALGTGSKQDEQRRYAVLPIE